MLKTESRDADLITNYSLIFVCHLDILLMLRKF